MKTVIFTVVAPGTVGLYVPQMLRQRSGDHTAHFVVKGLGTPSD